MEDDKICLCSGDGHVGPPTEVYKDYLETRLHSAFDEYYEHHVWRWSPQSTGSLLPPTYNSKFWGTEGFDSSRGTAVVWDANLRLRAMDEAMIACDVLVPDDQNANDPPWGSGLASATVDGPQGSLAYPPELVQAGARAYNRWLVDFCSAEPNRLLGVTILGTAHDLGWCVDEIHRAYESGLRTGILLPLDYYLPLYHHPRYDVLWETCSELNLSVVNHVSRGHPHYLGEDPWVQKFMYVSEAIWYAQRPIWCLIMGGVLERFPNLRLVITELGVDWVPEMLRSLDDSAVQCLELQASRDVERRVDLSIRPSEYWQRQCFVTHSTFQRRAQFEDNAYNKVPNMVFGADIGHAEGWWPVFGFPEPRPLHNARTREFPILRSGEVYKWLLGGLPSAKILPYLQDNFFKAYSNVARATLDGTVARIGPTTVGLGLS
jgi:predicted TIM-barrel fold metal-dependent hydrolase